MQVCPGYTVDANLSVLRVVIVTNGEDIPGLTDTFMVGGQKS